MAKYMVMGEISYMSAALRRAVRSTHQNDHLNDLMQTFASLKEMLNQQSDLSDIEPNVYFTPFLEVIRSEETNASVTAMALTAVSKFLQYGLIDHRLDSAAVAADNIVGALKKMSYITDDSESDEVVLMKFLTVIRSLLLSQTGCLLTNTGLCELIQSIIKIIFNQSFGVLLKKMAEQTWGEVVQLLFARLPQFSEDVEDIQLKQLLRGTGVIDHRNQRRRIGHTRPKKKKTNKEEMPFSVGGIVEETPLETTALLQEPEALVPNGSGDGVERPDAVVESQESVESREDSCAVGLTDSVEVLNKEAVEDEAHVMHMSGSITSLNEVEQSLESEAPESPVESVGKDFESPRSGYPVPSERIPYGLSSVKELLKFISVIICPTEPFKNPEEIIALGLELLTIALEVGRSSIGLFPSLVELMKDDVCKSLLSLLRSERISILVSTMRVCFLLFESLRPHLKFQLESYLLKLMELITYDGPNKLSYEIKELAIDNIVSLWRIPGFVSELYLNYDCDLYCSNLFEDLTKTLSKTAFPVTAIYSVHHLSLEALLAVIDTVETHCHFMMVSSKDDRGGKRRSMTETLLRPVAASGVQLAAVVDDRNEGCEVAVELQADPIPGPKEVQEIKHRKKVLRQGTELFNQKGSKGIQFLMDNGYLKKPLDVNEVATFLRTNYQLDKKQVGEYISLRQNHEQLHAYVRSFNFTDIRIDDALRVYLESFRLPGEAKPIEWILEQFAQHWHTSNKEPFASADAAFTLAYGIIMLNVDQHNMNAQKQSVPMKEDDFVRNLRSTNGSKDFDRQLLVDIYNSIKTDEIVMPAEQTGIVRENYLWKVLLKRGSSDEGRFTECPGGVLDEQIFTLSWSPTLVALSYLLDKCVDDTVLIHKLISGYRKCATIAAHYGKNEVFDHLIQALYKFTGISSADSQLAVLQSLGGDQRAQLTAKVMFTLAHKHGDVMKDGWKQVIDCSLILYKSGLMPLSMTTADDFVEPKGYVSIARRQINHDPKTDQGLFSSIVSYITSSESAAQKEQEAQLRKIAQSCVLNFHPEFIFSESTFLRTSALEELVRNLILSCPVPQTPSYVVDSGYDEESTIFGLELLLKVVLKNKDRIHTIWAPVRDHLFALVMGASARDYKSLLSRSVVGMLRLALRLCKGDQMGSQVLQCLALLLLLKPNTIRFVSKQIVYGLHELLRTSATCLTCRADWQTVFALLSVAGAGLKPSSGCQAMMLDSELSAKIASACAEIQASDAVSIDSGVQSDSEASSRPMAIPDSDRGYTSDSEICRTPKHHHHHPQHHGDHNREMAGSWILVGQEDSSPTKGSVNQYTISLHGCELLPHDPFAMTKAAQCLTQLVRDSSQKVNSLNTESCILCIRVFVEASLRSHLKRSKHSKSRTLKSKSIELPSNSPDSENSAPPEYEHIAIHLIDVMFSLHQSSFTDIQNQDSSDVWTTCWCPLLQGMARFCCDNRKEVRSLALNNLQKALFLPDFKVLKAEQWESCFNQVLFPLLSALLERNIYDQTAAADETRLRVITMLSKLYLLYLSHLLTLPTYTALFLTILDFMDKFMHLESSGETLIDAVPECLKNMLLVMDTAGAFRNEAGARTELWSVTWDRVSAFLPKLQEEIYRQPEPAASPPVQSPISQDPSTVPQQRPVLTQQGPLAPQHGPMQMPQVPLQPMQDEPSTEESESLPPVVSLEEAMRTPLRKTPLAIGGILLQETPLTPNPYSSTSIGIPMEQYSMHPLPQNPQGFETGLGGQYVPDYQQMPQDYRQEYVDPQNQQYQQYYQQYYQQQQQQQMQQQFQQQQLQSSPPQSPQSPPQPLSPYVTDRYHY